MEQAVVTTLPGLVDKYGLAVVLIGVIVWAGWYLLTKTIPKMQDTFAAQQAAERAQAAEQMKAERNQCNAHHADVVSRIEKHAAESADAHKETRHAVANLAGEVKLDRAVREQRQAPP